MRRLTALAFVLAAVATGCVNSENADQDAGNTPGTTCSEVITCLNGCSNSVCGSACESQGSSQAQELISALTACMDQACPTTTGGVCETQTASCTSCIQDAQSIGGACINQLAACGASSGSTDMDAGTPVVFGCGEVNNCIAACSGDQTCGQNCFDEGTTTAQDLYNAEGTCFSNACPQTAGGVCASDTSECQTCAESAIAQTGACNMAIIQCDTDNSGTGSEVAPSNNGGCAALVGCLNSCASTDATCQDGCQAAATLNGTNLLQAVDGCDNTACPSTTGGACSSSQTTCDACINSANSTGGACFTEYLACSSD